MAGLESAKNIEEKMVTPTNNAAKAIIATNDIATIRAGYSLGIKFCSLLLNLPKIFNPLTAETKKLEATTGLVECL